MNKSFVRACNLVALLLFLSAAQRSIGSEETLVENCRLSSLQMVLPTPLFRSFACAECFYFIYGIDPMYSTKYYFQRCPVGIRLCDMTSDDSVDCTCRNGPVYNLPEFSNESTPLSQMRLDPPLPNDFLKMTRDCCTQAEACCRNVMSHKEIAKSTNESAG